MASKTRSEVAHRDNGNIRHDPFTRIEAALTSLVQGGGGYVPARILRSFLKRPGTPNIPIQAIGLSLYEQLPSSSSANHANGVVGTDPDVEQPGTKVTRTQWLDLSSLEMANLIGKNILIVDEVDDTRTTLEYAVKELKKDVETARIRSWRNAEEGKTTFNVFVLHVSQILCDLHNPGWCAAWVVKFVG